MAKAVLTTKINPSYDDLPEVQYHFPSTYLNYMQKALGDWIVYYEPRRASADLSSLGGRQSYFATARVVDINPDPRKVGHYYAYVENYVEFNRPVPFREDDFYYESRLQKENGSTNKGSFGRSVRLMEDFEYSRILEAGIDKRNRLDVPEGPELEEAQPIIERLVQRPFRDRMFSAGIKRAYNNTCAISGIKIINGGGRAEVQAAHIRPVAANGPDSLRNGVALSSTFHWMFDRGLIAIADDYSLLLKENAIPNSLLSLVKSNQRLRLPDQRIYRPHSHFLEYHRKNVFKG
ncbi:MAG: restriction endonuclease [Rhodothermaceae bacterium]|nr:restriction endonuclease [Rhodothermaceae bacterium]MYG70126.1 restriction endonuclease [Rhodothermaceae bacterium]MYJ45044.1 restriction endonuclease [Rhodothermaceae bacterium]